ncbi:aminoglycoside phosphotransferase family protein [Streptomyces sp. NPDC048057]|uniref:phosphotransferase family protein n=1 Tax=Streptomyces sp. NPDC048057 TaxID=3155628 RepID=UPI0033CA4DE6
MPHPSALDADAVRRLLSLESPPVLPVRRVAEGSEHVTWTIGRDRVLRMAVDEETSERQRREVRLRDALREHLPVAVPRSLASGEWAPGLAYTVDGLLPGLSAERRTVSGTGEQDLSGLLAGLRSYDADSAGEDGLGLPSEPWRDLAGLTARAQVAARQLAADREFDPTLVERRLHTPPDPEPSAVLLHNDLKGEHLLVDEDGALTGVLDWTDAALGDPAEDVAGLALSVGASAAVRAAALASYGPQVCLRGLWLARCDTLLNLADALYGQDDSPIPLLRSQRGRAWQLTPLDL